ncbi:uncharacterized protein BDR25DRAFT_80523 [Lindgomyces ingoldianus]|uniref:Uncharacterized protein n=1 Tax=Lindgomyces ingoldianus TaxID=673940 RepID=A0ACB6QFV8_9PLEO|nr:uncharacterized protein BDR25DRAFT_80523 [Lindgomyces ingoldianus]KAF2465868.1 hypothetical protein BDR25DRAFT_80523 [Lindgomyces ingoldianus]
MAQNRYSGTRLLLPFLAPLFLPSAYAATTTTSAAIALITDSDFIGYTSDGTTWSANYCPSSSAWYQTSTWGRCCPTTTTNSACGIWTTCLDKSVIIEKGGRNATCSGANSICRTAFISQDSNDQNPFIYVGCGTGNWTAFRTPPAAVVKTLTSIAMQTDGDNIPTTALSDKTPSNTSPAPSATHSSESGGGSSSKAWIAGAVIGPIALAVIAGLLFYIWSLKRSKKEDPSAAPMMGQQPVFAQGQEYHPQGSPYTGMGYQQPYDQQHPEYYAGGNKMPYYADQGMAGIQHAPVEIDNTQIQEAPAEPMSPQQHPVSAAPK